MAFGSTTTKRRTEVQTTETIQVLSGGAGTGALIFGEGLPYQTAHIVVTSGTSPTNVQLQAGNDGNTANMVNLGTAVTSFPALYTISPGDLPYKYHQWVVTGGDATTVITITELWMGTRG